MKTLQKQYFLLMILLSFTCLVNGQECSDSGKSLPDWALGAFKRPQEANPVISPDSVSTFFCPMQQKKVHWEANDTFNPAATVYKGKIVLLYRAEDKSGVGIGHRTSRLGYASSRNGLTFKRDKKPVLYPADDAQKKLEWPGGCEDPRIVVSKNGLYVMTYTQWNRQIPRLAIATSKDLKHWIKYGPAFAKAYGGKFYNLGCKSGSILTEVMKGKQTVKRINGHYFMYWGEDHVYGAVSDNLVDWRPLIDDNGVLKVLFSPRDGYFDSQLTECGPPALYTNKGIILLYNGKNRADSRRDKRYTANVYAAGQALFDAENPARFVTRLDIPFLYPKDSFEKNGQYPDGTVFIEGLVFYKNKWYLYYGCADSRVGTAIYDPKNSNSFP